MHTRIHRFNTHAHELLLGGEKNKPNKPTNKKYTPQTNKHNKTKKPHPTPQESSKSNRKGAFTSEVKGRCVSSGDPRCSISLEFVKDSGRAGGTEKGRRCLRVHTYAR